MKAKYLALIPALFIARCVSGQIDQTETLKNLYDNGKYDEVINYTPKNNEALVAKSLYYVGNAYYMEEKDEKALQYFDSAIHVGPADSYMYYLKGMTLFYMKEYKEALPVFDKAISMSPEEADIYGSKGDAYIELDNLDSALVYFRKATSLDNCKPRYYGMIGEVLSHQNKNKEALKAFQDALKKLNPADNQDDYSNCLYNIGLMQQLTGDSTGAKTTFEKFVSLNPADYHAIAKLIQVYYSMGDFEKAKPFKKILYDAHKTDSLPDEMKKMFCFDQFIWNGKRVMAFECYDEPADVYMYVKHHFYILSDSGTVMYQIQSESDELLHKEHPDEMYVLCLVKDNAYHTYWNFIFNDDVKYPALKHAVLDILNDKVKPTAETYPGK